MKPSLILPKLAEEYEDLKQDIKGIKDQIEYLEMRLRRKKQKLHEKRDEIDLWCSMGIYRGGAEKKRHK